MRYVVIGRKEKLHTGLYIKSFRSVCPVFHASAEEVHTANPKGPSQ